jgi:hypothetical protein
MYVVAGRIDVDLKELASRVLDAILYLAEVQEDEEPTLISRAKQVKKNLANQGFDYSDGRICDFYRTAHWVSKQHVDDECRWLEHRSFSAHERARRRAKWDWERLILEMPPSKAQGDEGGKLGSSSMWRRIVKEIRRGSELVDVGMRNSRGYEKRQHIIMHDDAQVAEEYAKKVADRHDNV